MAYFTDPTPSLELVVSRLAAVDVQATLNPADVNTPGVWVKWVGYSTSVLSGDEFVRVECHLVVAANAMPEAIKQLVALGEEVVEELGHPDGPERIGVTTFGADPVPLPTLVLPYNVDAI